MDACRTPAWRLRGALGRRRLSGSSPHHPAHEHEVFDLGDGVMARTPGDDSWGVVGHVLRMHNSFWGWAGDEYSECRMAGYVGNFTFPNGSTSRYTYVIECEGHH